MTTSMISATIVHVVYYTMKTAKDCELIKIYAKEADAYKERDRMLENPIYEYAYVLTEVIR